LPPYARERAAVGIARRFAALPAWRAAQRIGLYLPADGEVDVRPLARLAWSQDKAVYLPVVGAIGEMDFARWSERQKLCANRYGIPEPVTSRRHRLAARRLDLLVMPLVAFDRHGLRLGMGGGYYDRALAARPRHPVLAGAAYSVQQVERIPPMPWDVPLDLIVTERRVYRPRPPVKGAPA
jgi:5-formyltetrahydrofolate cyclo-ligase